MKIRRGLWCVPLCLASVIPLLGADGGAPGYLPAGARVVIGIRVRGLVESIMAKGIGQEAQSVLKGAISQSAMAGINPLRDVDEVWLASTGVGQNPPFLAVMTGRFNEGAFSAGGKRYRNSWIAESKGNAQQVVAFVNAGTALAGDAKLVRAALDLGENASQIDSDLAASVAALHGKYDLWGAGKPVPGPRTAAGADPLNTMDRFEFGASFTHGMDIVADFHVRSPQDLEQLNSSLKMIALALNAQPANPDNGRFDVRTENGGIHVAISIPEEALKKAVASQRAAITSAVAAQLAQRGIQAPATAAATPSPAVPHISTPMDPAEVQVLKNSRGDAVMVTLPGKK